ncbi:hypothetical protein [Bacillus thuringiensis]|uniref:hypothetical protein n=1 Tax=Bacillus thuringiensis TaxID=1428 RepID=UPI002868807C|nr:hypothetical protein [Bacillus thuringiensis]
MRNITVDITLDKLTVNKIIREQYEKELTEKLHEAEMLRRKINHLDRLIWEEEGI